MAFFLADSRLYVLACLLKPEAHLKVENKLSSNNLQIPFMGDVVKGYR